MKQAAMLVLAFVIVWLLWSFVAGILGGILFSIIKIAMIIGFCYAVYSVYKLLMNDKQKIRY